MPSNYHSIAFVAILTLGLSTAYYTTEDYEYTTEDYQPYTTEDYPHTTDEYPYTTTPSPDLCFVPGEVTGMLLGAVSSPDFDECIDICAETAGCSWDAIQWHKSPFLILLKFLRVLTFEAIFEPNLLLFSVN